MTLARFLQNVNFALFDQRGVTISGLTNVIDRNPDVRHNQSVSVTPYPIESGGSLTDNAVVEPNSLVIEGFVSDLLIEDATAINLPSEARASAAWGLIVEMKNRREPVTVTTQLQTYENMLITNISATQNVDTGRALRFIINLEEVLFTDTFLTRFTTNAVDQAGPAANKTTTVDRGTQQPRIPTTEEREIITSRLIVADPLSTETLRQQAATVTQDLPAEAIQVIPVSNDSDQTFQIRLAGQTIRVDAYYQDIGEGWYANIRRNTSTFTQAAQAVALDVAVNATDTQIQRVIDNTDPRITNAITSGARMVSGSPMLSGLITDFTGDIVAVPVGSELNEPGRNPWGTTHELVYLTDEAIEAMNLAFI